MSSPVSVYRGQASHSKEGWKFRFTIDGNDILVLGPTWNRTNSLAQEGISDHTGLSKEDFRIRVELADDSLSSLVADVKERREEAFRAQKQYTENLKGAVNELRSLGLTVRDIGAILGISYQYASRLAGKQHHTFKEETVN